MLARVRRAVRREIEISLECLPSVRWLGLFTGWYTFLAIVCLSFLFSIAKTPADKNLMTIIILASAALSMFSALMAMAKSWRELRKVQEEYQEWSERWRA